MSRTKARSPALDAYLAGAHAVDIEFRGPGGEYSAASCKVFGWRVWDRRRRYPHEVAAYATAEEAIKMARRLAAGSKP